ncbi:MAG TPA: tRNA (adenosine(37)-N6)-dimethylallyltransferase MiaA [Aestuariivirgaceae bacterium]|nr:tRNA (adenosine(37)-N6)-dimethylallyltransferase MiaA [Aestuariivirgaceae bacterium]
MAERRRAILIAGPTASGKSAAALDLAQALGGVIVNADAMQVYAEIKVLSARPGPEEQRLAPHRLFGHVPARQAYSVSRWLADARGAIGETWGKGRAAIVVGGTGLYFRSLDQGLAEVPDVPAKIRAKWRRALAERGSEALHEELSIRAPEEGRRLRPSDGQRIARALEVLEATGEPLAVHHARGAATSPLAGAAVTRIAIIPERAALYRRCDARFVQMMERGALDEVKRLLALDLDPALPAMRAIGVQALARHLTGEIDCDEAVRIAQRETRNYAKRQLTWLRHQMPAFQQVDDADAAVATALTFADHEDTQRP